MTAGDKISSDKTFEICKKIMEATGPENGSVEEHIAALTLCAAHLHSINPLGVDMTKEEVGEMALAGVEAMVNKMQEIVTKHIQSGGTVKATGVGEVGGLDYAKRMFAQDKDAVGVVLVGRVGAKGVVMTPGADIVEADCCGKAAWLAMETKEIVDGKPHVTICNECLTPFRGKQDKAAFLQFVEEVYKRKEAE